MEQLWHDARYAVRRLIAARAFSVFTLLLLAVGIGANTAIFSLLEGLALRTLPVPHPEQLVQLYSPGPDFVEGELTVSQFREIAKRQRVFTAMFGSESRLVGSIESAGALSHVMTTVVTGNFYDELGARAFAGRLIGEEDDRNAARVAVIGYDYWQRQFGGDPAIIGRTIRLDSIPLEIIGITARQFSGIELSHESDLTLPNGARFAVEAAANPELRQGPDHADLTVVGRLAPQITLAQANEQLQTIWPDVQSAAVPRDSELPRRTEFLARRLLVKSAAHGADEEWRSSVTRPLWLALAGAGLMLVIGVVNLAGLMLSRVVASAHEWSIRTALGATRWQMARPILVECLILTATGTGFGYPIATWGVAMFRRWTLSFPFPTTSPSLAPDLRVLGRVGIVMLLAAALVSAAAIAWLNRHRADLPVRTGMRATRRQIGPTLVTLQVSLSFVLLTTSALLARNLHELRSTRDLHYQRDGITIVSLDPRPGALVKLDPDVYQPRLAEKLSAIPGVREVSLGDAPAPKQWSELTVSRDGAAELHALQGRVSPGFFATLQLPLVFGRDFTWRDNSRAPHVAIISESLANQLFGGVSAVGQEIRLGGGPKDMPVEIVGVVADAKLYAFERPNPLVVFRALLQDMPTYKDILVRSDLPTPTIARQVQLAVDSFGQDFVWRSRTLNQLTDDELDVEWLTVELAGCFSTIGLVVSAIGLYSLLSYAIAMRRQELGIRLAVGAEPGRLVAFVAAGGLRLVAVGILLGFGLVLLTNRLVASLLSAASPFDLFALGATSLLLLAVGTVACLVPAMRVTRIDPLAVLRAE